MDFTLNDEQEMLRAMTRDFVAKELIPFAHQWDEAEEFPLAAWRKMGELGYMGMLVPEIYGGTGGDTLTYAVALEEISRGCAALGTVMSVHNSLACWSLFRYGTEEQKQKYLVPLATGQKLGGFCLTEPQAGSDAASLRLAAVRDGDDYILNGSKIFTTSGLNGHTFLVFARTNPHEKTRGITAFIVEKGTPGFQPGAREHKMGLRASDTMEMIFNECRLPAANVLGEIDEGFKIAMSLLDGGRIGIAAQATGIAQAAFDAAVRYAQERVQFGKPIAEFQAIQMMIADMATRIDAARLLVYRAAQLRDRHEKVTLAASMAKLFASETANFVVDRALQVHGGYGYIRDYAVERYYRDARVTMLYEGTSEIQRIVIAKELFKTF